MSSVKVVAAVKLWVSMILLPSCSIVDWFCPVPRMTSLVPGLIDKNNYVLLVLKSDELCWPTYEPGIINRGNKYFYWPLTAQRRINMQMLLYQENTQVCQSGPSKSKMYFEICSLSDSI